ncbi:MAG: hypothetical protein ACXACG_06815 [Candidatus Thorarchaeota archaeon]
MKKTFLDKAIALGEKTYSHFERNRYPHELIEEMFRGVSHDEDLWKTVKKSKEYRNLRNSITTDSEGGQLEVEDILREYMYDVGVFLHRWEGIDNKKMILQKAESLADDFTKNNKPAFIALAPLFLFYSDLGHIELENCIIRPARYSERIWYRPAYPKLVHPYGPERFDYLIELKQSDSLQKIDEKEKEMYLEICHTVTAAIRLVCGGTVGLEYLAARNHFERLELDPNRELGTTYPMDKIAHGFGRVWRPGKFPSILSDSSRKITFEYIFGILNEMDSEGFVWRGLRRFCGSVENRTHLDDSVIDVVIAFETLFVDDKDKASRRAATILSPDDGYDEEIAEKLRTLWKARNALVHGDSMEEAENRVGDLRNLMNFAHYCLHTCLLIIVALKPEAVRSFRREIDKASRIEITKSDMLRNVPRDILTLAGDLEEIVKKWS